MIKQSWIEKGYADEPIPAGTNLAKEIRKMCKEKNAVILAHFYTVGAIQDVADFVGDSLALAQKAAKTDADIIVMCGVNFMAETNKILCPDKTVLLPDLNSHCSLAESCPADKFAEFVKAHPGYKVLSYVNTSAAVKALTDVVVTSGNAKEIVESFPQDEKLIFGPDYNLGNYINSITGRNMLLWNGACDVHERFSVEKIVALKAQYPNAQILAHRKRHSSRNAEVMPRKEIHTCSARRQYMRLQRMCLHAPQHNGETLQLPEIRMAFHRRKPRNSSKGSETH